VKPNERGRLGSLNYKGKKEIPPRIQSRSRISWKTKKGGNYKLFRSVRARLRAGKIREKSEGQSGIASGRRKTTKT